MQDEQNLERVRLTFEKFNIPMSPQSDCEDGYLKVYMKGQEKEHHYEEHDYQFCGRETPPTVKTEGPRLVLLFKAGQKPGSGFKGNFKFETEYLIPIGTPAPEGGCHFTYRYTMFEKSSKMSHFAFSNFGFFNQIFVQLKVTCLVTLFDPQASVFPHRSVDFARNVE